MAKKSRFPSLRRLPQNLLEDTSGPSLLPLPVVEALSLWYPVLIRTVSLWNFFGGAGDLSKALGH